MIFPTSRSLLIPLTLDLSHLDNGKWVFFTRPVSDLQQHLAPRVGLAAASQPNLVKVLLSLRTHRQACLLCLGVDCEVFWSIVYNDFSGPPQRFECIHRIKF